MRTNNVVLPTKTIPELSRRIKKLRDALGYRQADLAEVLGCGQQNVATWENGGLPKGIGVLVSRFSILAEYLSDPMKNKNSLLRPNLEPNSPVLSDTAGNRRLIEALTDLSITPEEWDEALDGQLWAHSKAPFKASALIKARDEAPEERVKGFRAPPDEAPYLADIKIHGEEFVQRMRAGWHARDAIAKAESEELLYLAKGAGGSILLFLALELEKMGRPQIAPPYLWKFRNQSPSLDEISKEDIERLMGPDWIGKPEKFLPAMEFFSTVADWVTDSDGVPIAPLLEKVLSMASSFRRTSLYNEQHGRRQRVQVMITDKAAWEGFETREDSKGPEAAVNG